MTNQFNNSLLHTNEAKERNEKYIKVIIIKNEIAFCWHNLFLHLFAILFSFSNTQCIHKPENKKSI